VYVGRDEAEVRQRHRLPPSLELRQDEDVLDTWFSSALWPFSTLGWPERTAELERYYPTTVLVTGFDIIFFWVARMIMMGLKFMGDVPFREVYIHGLVRDAEGQKMAKSKGNILDPLDLIDGATLDALLAKRTGSLMQPHMKAAVEKATRKQFPRGLPAFGTDALRFTFAALATQGRDVRFDLGRIEGYRNFCNKLWNAARYVWLVTNEAPLAGDAETGLPERWIRSRLRATARTVREQLAAYRFDLATQALYEFTWHELCDWYLELSKPVLQDADAEPARARGTRRTLLEVLEAVLRMLHPLMPFITAEIWQRIAPLAGRTGRTIMLEPYPAPEDYAQDDEAEVELAWIMSFVLGIRQIRGEMDIAPSRAVPVLLQDATAADLARVERHRTFVQRLANVGSLAPLGAGAAAPAAATALLGTMKLLVPLAGLIDPRAEIARLEKRLGREQAERVRLAQKLDNTGFVSRAPAGLVEEERRRLTDLERACAQLEAQIERLRPLAASTETTGD
jgi:valyl-tRNA synthetase